MSERQRTEHQLWPGPDTLHLLRAALLDGDEAQAGFAAWLATGPSAKAAEVASPDRRLLPLVAARMRSHGVEHAYLAVCDDVSGPAEERNRRLLEGAASALATLERAGIRTLALKGLPLLIEHYRDPSLRPMADVDLMIHPADLSRAMAALRAAGWSDRRPVPRWLRRWVIAFELERTTLGQKLDLHQYLIEYGSSPETERDLWRRAHEIEVLGARCLAPAPTDMLLHVCVAALKYGRRRNSRWVPDAMLLLRDGGVDWALLVREAERRGVALPLRECLQYLVDELEAPVPEGPLAALWGVPVTPEQVARYRVLTQLAPSLPQLANEYVSLYGFAARASGSRPGPLGFAAFTTAQLAHRWRLDSLWRLPPNAMRRLVRKARGR